MKKNIRKIITTSLLSAMSVTAIGCSTTDNKLAKNIDKGMAQFVSSINKLDFVDTSSPVEEGKIVETSVKLQSNNHFLANNISNVNVENTITRPSERDDTFKLFVLSSRPYVSLTSDDNSASFEFCVKFSTDKIQETSDEIDEKINKLILKRSILMIYVNEIYNGNVTISDENKVAINAYVNVIKENASFLNGNRGMVKNQLNLASDLVDSDKNDNLVNYYIIKSGEALETRSNKIDSTISAIDSIINILENNLTSSSSYYNTKLSVSYENLINNLQPNSTKTETNTTNIELADNIAKSLGYCCIDNDSTNNEDKSNSTTQNGTTSTESGIMTLPLTDNNKSTNVTSQNNTQSNTQNNTQNSTAISNNQLANNRQSTENQNSNISGRSTNTQTTQNSSINNNQNNINNSSTINNTNNTNRTYDYNRRYRGFDYQNKERNNISNNRVIRDTANRRSSNNKNYTRNKNNNTSQNNTIVSTNNQNLENDMQNTNNTNQTKRTIKTTEEYNSTNTHYNQNQNRATRVPYQSSTNFNK